jgi:hypothetical protein
MQMGIRQVVSFFAHVSRRVSDFAAVIFQEKGRYRSALNEMHVADLPMGVINPPLSDWKALREMRYIQLGGWRNRQPTVEVVRTRMKVILPNSQPSFTWTGSPSTTPPRCRIRHQSQVRKWDDCCSKNKPPLDFFLVLL